MKIKCPKCGDAEADELAEEVDIGVGIQKFVYGVDCPTCGQISFCPLCGSPDFAPHLAWCKSVQPQ